jgi:Tol biopolymer transport system component
LRGSGPTFDTSAVPIRRLAAFVAFLLLVLAAACTSEPELPELRHVDIPSPTAEASAPVAPPEPEAPAATVPSAVSALAGRLAVLDGGGNLVTMDPDGTKEVVLAEIDPGLSEVRQPSWSRDGSRLAWVHLQVNEANALSVSVATSTDRGRKGTTSRTALVPFYLAWDPTSSRIAYLGTPEPNEVALGILEVAGPSSGTPLDSGQPFYLSWGPAGDELLVHVGEQRLERLGLDGKLTTVADRPGSFTAPVWTADGRTFVYASTQAGRQQLVVHDADAERGHAVVPFGGLISFVVSPDGKRIAFQPFDQGDSLPLTVVDVVSGETAEIMDEAAAAFFWSPDGERLLYLDPDPDGERLWYRWGVWDGRRSFRTTRFVPSPVMTDQYFPFFEQYAQSMSLWSPDGKAFAYSGANEDGDAGIWIQSARSDRAPVLVSDGDFVAWSPT